MYIRVSECLYNYYVMMQNSVVWKCYCLASYDEFFCLINVCCTVCLLLLYCLFVLLLLLPQKVQERWYESLHDWEAAHKAYTERQKQRPDDISLTLGKMRCLHAMGEWSVGDYTHSHTHTHIHFVMQTYVHIYCTCMYVHSLSLSVVLSHIQKSLSLSH